MITHTFTEDDLSTLIAEVESIIRLHRYTYRDLLELSHRPRFTDGIYKRIMHIERIRNELARSLHEQR